MDCSDCVTKSFWSSFKAYKKNFSHMIALACTIGPAGASEERKTEVTFIDGMRIETDNAVANVEIRAKSMGPGACAVRFSSSEGDSVAIIAPPLVWSDWHVLFGHVGKYSATLSAQQTCDTGFIASVQYYSAKE